MHVNIPSRLDEWTIAHVEALVSNVRSEDQDFDFKGAAILTEVSGIAALSKAAAAFANGRGGSIIIGVRDSEPRRIEGVKVDAELAKRVHDRIKVYPPITYPAPRAIPWKDGLSVIVVDIPASTEGPHASVADKLAAFYVRTHAGAEPMSWPAIRDAMVRADDRQRYVEILLGELQQHNLTARAHRIANMTQGPDFPETQTFELDLTKTALAALYPWIAKDPHLGPEMSRLLARMSYINGQVQAMIIDTALRPDHLHQWRGRMSVVCLGFRDRAVQVDAGLRLVFGMPAVDDYKRILPEY